MYDIIIVLKSHWSWFENITLPNETKKKKVCHGREEKTNSDIAVVVNCVILSTTDQKQRGIHVTC